MTSAPLRDRWCGKTLPALVSALALTIGSVAHGAEAAARDEEAPPGPGVVLVLSGGGARGAAHIGVLQVMEELQVPVDMVIGTSMGSVVGGLYAAGWSPEDLVGIISAIDWTAVFSDAIPYQEKSYRRKQDDAASLVRGTIRFRDGKPYLPLGLFEGRRIELVLKSLELQSTPPTSFDELPIPYRAVAADLDTSEAVVLDHGSLARAIRASMSIPGAFAPVEIDGRKLVDGGIAANLPVDVALGLGARRIIAVNISSPLSREFEGRNFLSVMMRLNSFLTSGNVGTSIDDLRPEDLLLTPALGDLSFVDFERMPEAIEIGRQCALERAEELRRFAVDDAAWAKWRGKHRQMRSRNLRIGRLEVRNTSGVADGVIAARFEHHVGTSLDVGRLSDDVMDLHGLDIVGTVEVDLEDGDDGSRVLVVAVGPSVYGRHSLRFGLNLRDDFESEVGYGLTVRHRVLPINRKGGEWLNDIRIGDVQRVSTELYQPLDDRLVWFVSPFAGYDRTSWSLWYEGKPFSQLWLRSIGGGLDGGRVLGNWGELRLGAFWVDRTIEERVAVPGLVSFEGIDAGARLRFGVRTLDAPVFPTNGTVLDLELSRSLEAFGAEQDFTETSLQVDHALTVGRFSFVPGLQLYRSSGDNEHLFATRTLGGFWQLSGYGEYELLGQEVGLARIVTYGEIFEFAMVGLSTRVYGGMSIEAGNAWSADSSPALDDVLWSGSAFLGADTFIGPVYLGYGRAERGRYRWYLNIGASF